MPNSPSICICVPTYNSSKTIIDTLNSISAIDYDNFRIIVVDNNSQDNTIDLINNNFEDIPVYKNSITVSPESNFDRCINLSNEDFTCIFHSDDIYHRKILKEQIAIFHSNTQIGVVFTEAIKIDELNQSLGEINFPFNVNKINCLSHDQLLILICKYSNFLICPSAMIDTKLIKKKLFKWNSKYKSSSDLYVWLTLSKYKKIYLIDKPLMKYRVSKNQGSYLNRTGTKRSDFLNLITHCYKNNTNIFNNKNVFYNYKLLFYLEFLLRAHNIIKIRKFVKAKKLLRNISLILILKTLFVNSRSFKMLIFYFYLKFLIIIK